MREIQLTSTAMDVGGLMLTAVRGTANIQVPARQGQGSDTLRPFTITNLPRGRMYMPPGTIASGEARLSVVDVHADQWTADVNGGQTILARGEDDQQLRLVSAYTPERTAFNMISDGARYRIIETEGAATSRWTWR